MRALFSIGFTLIIVLISSCSQEKNTILSRTYHNTTARYNGYFNGRMALKEAHETMKEGYQEDYTSLLPMFIYDNEDVVRTVYPKLDRTIEKTSLVIDRHSIDLKGTEYCKWIDNAWIVMGEAQYLKGEELQAKQIFDFTKRKYKDPETRSLSQFWLARLLIKKGEYDRGLTALRKVTLEDGFPEKQLSELYAVRADFFIKQMRYEKAIEELERCITYTKKRKIKNRRMFILAQLYRLEGDGAKSSDTYAELIKRNPDYEMAFYAKINRALAFDVNNGNVEEVRKILFKMLKDEKNAEFQDQIYYALAELELKEGDEPEAIDYLKLATKNSVKNGNAKGLAFYRLADIYFEKPNYPVAQAYYDSTVAFLSQAHPDYDVILGRANSLTQMMRDMNIVERQDSLQAFASLSEKEQEKIIQNKIDDLIQAEQDEERQKELNELRSQQASFQQNTQINKNITRGEWYFYNPAAVGFGAGEFTKIWGRRKNEDNWRRSDKTSLAPLLVEDDFGDGTAEDTTAGANDPKNPNFYRKEVPNTDEQLERSHALIVEALYDLSLVYKGQMNDPLKAAETLEELISRYDSSKYQLTSYYQLYLIYGELGKYDKSNYYKDLLLNDYPESEYAQVIRNPDFMMESLAQEEEVSTGYSRAYAYYEQGYYSESYSVIDQLMTKYPKNELEAKFQFLRALDLGFVKDEAAMLEALRGVKQQYYSQDEGKEAERILNYFANGKKIKSSVAEMEEQGEEEEAQKEASKFSFDIGASHNFILVVPDTANVLSITNSISDFNRIFFSTRGFKTSSIPLKDGSTMIVVANVGIVNKAMDYYKTLTQNNDPLGKLNANGYPSFVISYDNYAQFYKSQNTDAYSVFFQEKYIKTN